MANLNERNFDLENYSIHDSIKEALELSNEAYMVCFTKDGDYVTSEVHDGDFYIGGDGYEYVNDSNIGFMSTEDVEHYYEREYVDVIVFIDETERDQFESQELE